MTDTRSASGKKKGNGLESSLSLQYVQLKGEVGEFLGFGRGPDNGKDSVWDAAQTSDIDFCVSSGMRVFYFSSGYDWSFLSPGGSSLLKANAQTCPLPDDFGSFDGPLTIQTSGSTSMPWRIEWRNEGAIREMYSINPTQTGPPMFAAQSPLRGTTGLQGQRFQLFIFPAADQAYTIQFNYDILPDYLSGAFPFAYGGAAHAETLLESCLAIAEQRRDDAMSVHTAKYKELLEQSKAYDSRNKPQKLGPNFDHSDDAGYNRSNAHWWAPAATYNGGAFG